MPSSSSAGVRVFVRVRPMLPREVEFNSAVDVMSTEKVMVYRDGAEFKSNYNYVFSEQTQQTEVYEQVRSGVLSALQGYNSTFMAYGQTGSGKTFTMFGPHDLDLLAAKDPHTMPPEAWASVGLVPRALADLFKEVQSIRQRGSARVQVVASYVEIHNDRIYDLLQPYKKGMGSRDPHDVLQRKAVLEVREDRSGATHLPSMLSIQVPSYGAVLSLLSKGNNNRAVRHTEMNMHSSRSHAILQLLIEQWPGQAEDAAAQQAGGPAPKGTVVRSKVNFIDLAGSERWNKDTVMGSDRISEMTAINSSLSALAGVVSALTEGVSRKHVPYRDSKLTNLLQDSLGGNCKTVIIANISPCVNAFEETVSTLKFADRARAIANNPVVNKATDMGSVLVLKEKEIQRLRQLLSSYMQQQQQHQQMHTLTGTQSLQSTMNQSQNFMGGMGGDSLSSLPQGAAELLAQLDEAKQALEQERQWRLAMETQMQHPSSSPQSSGFLSSSNGLMPPRSSSATLSFSGGNGGLLPSSHGFPASSHGLPGSEQGISHRADSSPQQPLPLSQPEQGANPAQRFDLLRVSTHYKDSSTEGELSTQPSPTLPYPRVPEVPSNSQSPSQSPTHNHSHSHTAAAALPQAAGSLRGSSVQDHSILDGVAQGGRSSVQGGRAAWATPKASNREDRGTRDSQGSQHLLPEMISSGGSLQARAEEGGRKEKGRRGRSRKSAGGEEDLRKSDPSIAYYKQQLEGGVADRLGKAAVVIEQSQRAKGDRYSQRSKQLTGIYGNATAFSKHAAASNYSADMGRGALSSSEGYRQHKAKGAAAGGAMSARAAYGGSGSKARGAPTSPHFHPRINIYGSNRIRPRPSPKVIASSDAAFQQALAAAHASVSQKPSTPKKHAAAPLRSPTKAPPKSKQWGNNSLRKSGGLPAEISDLNLSNSDDDLVMQRELEQLQAQHAQLMKEQAQQEEEQMRQLREARSVYQQGKELQREGLSSGGKGAGVQSSGAASPTKWGRSSIASSPNVPVLPSASSRSATPQEAYSPSPSSQQQQQQLQPLPPSSILESYGAPAAAAPKRWGRSALLAAT